MKNSEKEIKKLLSDSMLLPSNSFKKSLRKDVMRKANPRKSYMRFMIPTLGASLAVIALTVGVLTFDGKNIARNPFTPQTVSAAQLIKNIAQLPKTLGESGKSFMVASYSITDGPARKAWCAEAAGMGDFGEGTGRSFIYNDKNSGHEASYTEFRYASGKPSSQIMYYNANSEQLMESRTGYSDGIPYSTDPNYQIAGQPVYLIVGKDGEQVKDDTLQSKKVNGEEVYEFYVRQNTAVTGTYGIDQPGGCAQSRIITAVTVDAATNVITKSVNYVDSVNPENMTLGTTYSVELKDVDEATALRIMTKAGFDKSKASSEGTGSKES